METSNEEHENTQTNELDLSNKGLTTFTVDSHHGTLRKLNLHGNQLTSVPPELGQLSALTWLNLHNNQLTSVPPELGQLSALTLLLLSVNQLTSVPPELGQLSALTILHLGHNQLSSVPPEFGQLSSLTILNLDDNQLTSVPPQLGQLTELTELTLDSNQLTSLPYELGQLSALTLLYRGNNPPLLKNDPVLASRLEAASRVGDIDDFRRTLLHRLAQKHAILERVRLMLVARFTQDDTMHDCDLLRDIPLDLFKIIVRLVGDLGQITDEPTTDAAPL